MKKNLRQLRGVKACELGSVCEPVSLFWLLIVLGIVARMHETIVLYISNTQSGMNLFVHSKIDDFVLA